MGHDPLNILKGIIKRHTKARQERKATTVLSESNGQTVGKKKQRQEETKAKRDPEHK